MKPALFAEGSTGLAVACACCLKACRWCAWRSAWSSPSAKALRFCASEAIRQPRPFHASAGLRSLVVDGAGSFQLAADIVATTNLTLRIRT